MDSEAKEQREEIMNPIQSDPSQWEQLRIEEPETITVRDCITDKNQAKPNNRCNQSSFSKSEKRCSYLKEIMIKQRKVDLRIEEIKHMYLEMGILQYIRN